MEEQFSSLTLTKLAKVKVDPHAKIKVKGQMVQTGDRPQTNGRYQMYTVIHNYGTSYEKWNIFVAWPVQCG